MKDWVAAGGTIVALGDAVNFLGNSKVELLELLQENALREGDDKKAADKADKGSTRVPGTAIASETDFDKITRAATELPDSVTEPDFAAAIRDVYDKTAIPADSFARTVVFAMSQPDDVDINEILFRPTSQEY